MSNLHSMLERNKDFARLQSSAGTLMPWLPQALPNVRAIIIGCADMRVDPAHVLGIKPGEAVVMRNIGGRITPGLLEEMGLLGRIGEVAGEIPGGGGEFHLIVLQHTDCGITRLAGDPSMLTQYFQIQEAELETKAVTDPRIAVAVDVALLRAVPALPGEWFISGLVYDVATGLVEIVIPPAQIRGMVRKARLRVSGAHRSLRSYCLLRVDDSFLVEEVGYENRFSRSWERDTHVRPSPDNRWSHHSYI